MQGGMSTRPTGVTILAVLGALGGIFGILVGIGLLGFGSFLVFAAGTGAFVQVLGLVFLVLGIAELAVAYGFWNLRLWAWQYGILVAVLYIVVDVLWVILANGNISYVIGGVIVSAILLYYLNTPDVRRAFGAPEKGWPFIGGRY